MTLIPSTEETFSNTAAESVSCGTPIVGFQVGAIPEIAQGVRGRAVAVDNVEALAGGLSEFLTKEIADPSELYRYIAETFGADAIGERYFRLFEQLRARPGSPTPKKRCCVYR